MEGKVEALCVSQRKGEKKHSQGQVELRVDQGIVGDAHAGPWHRQLSMLGVTEVEVFRSRGFASLDPGVFGENIRLSGVNLSELGVGSRLRLGVDAVLSVTQIGKACHQPCAIFHQVGDCIMPRAGLFCRVEAQGRVTLGDAVLVEHLVPRETIQLVVLTMSDRCARHEAEDTAGPAVAELLVGSIGAHLYRGKILPDKRDLLANCLRHYADGHSIDLVVVVGGTGFSPLDVTPEAVRDVVERLTPGIDEAMRRSSAEHTPHFWLSRAVSAASDDFGLLSFGNR
jgi:molybdenum cofactor synthesis domain-containing protein